MLAKQKTSVRKMRGFGLIELLITISLLGILTTLAVDNFGTWIQDTKTRSVAESLQNGIRLAQTESIKQSQNTLFNLASKNWTVHAIPRSSTTSTSINSTNLVIHQGTLSDSGSVTISELSKTSPSNQLKFNSMGRLTSPVSTVKYIVSNPKGKRRMQVSVNSAGKIRMCDPDGPDANIHC